MLAIDTVVARLEARITRAVRAKLLDTLRDDEVFEVDTLAGEPDAALRHELQQAGLHYRLGASDVLLLDPSVDMDSLSNRRVYAHGSSLGPRLASLGAGRVDAVIVDVDEDALRWALSNNVGGKAAVGYAVGHMLFDAVLASGRDITRSALWRSIDAIEVKSRLVVIR